MNINKYDKKSANKMEYNAIEFMDDRKANPRRVWFAPHSHFKHKQVKIQCKYIHTGNTTRKPKPKDLGLHSDERFITSCQKSEYFGCTGGKRRKDLRYCQKSKRTANRSVVRHQDFDSIQEKRKNAPYG